jgi:fructokinase
MRMSNKTRQAFTIGEVVFDIIFKNGQPVAAKPGGSMLNTAVSLGRSGLQVSFTGTCGNDRAGDLISGFLHENNVNTSYLFREDSQTIIALAFLDEKNNATYSFYKGTKPPIQPPLPSPLAGDILLYGSFYSLIHPTRDFVLTLRGIALDQGALVIYDPNFRESHLRDLDTVRPFIEDNILHSDIVRGSDEDFELIFGTGTSESTWELPCFRNCSALVYTRSAKGVELITGKVKKHYPVPIIQPLSTIGAGDSFNAGIISSLIEYAVSRQNIHECSLQQWDSIIERGIDFSTRVCMSYDNYIPVL